MNLYRKRKALMLIKHASERNSTKESKQKEKAKFYEHLPAHIISEVPYLSTLYGGYKGYQEGNAVKGAIFGAHGLQGAKDKREGNKGDNIGAIAASGAVSGGLSGIARGEYRSYKEHKEQNKTNKSLGIDAEVRPSFRNRIRGYGKPVLAGAITNTIVGTSGYKLGELFQSSSK